MCNWEEGSIVICKENSKQCEQLFNDLVQIIKKNRKSHFFESIVTSSANKGGKSDYLVINGQQRITTISILFTAMVNLMKSGLVEADDKRLAEKIEKKFLVDEYQTENRKTAWNRKPERV